MALQLERYYAMGVIVKDYLEEGQVGCWEVSFVLSSKVFADESDK